jgi:predicted nucleic acid-binding protein
VQDATAADIVLDASALIRGMLRESHVAAELLGRVDDGSTRAHAPDLIDAETTNALLVLVRVGRLRPEAVARTLEVFSASAVVRYPSCDLARAAFELAMDTGLSAYDAFYAVLAEVLDLPLVTADRKLAAAVGRSVLVA